MSLIYNGKCTGSRTVPYCTHDSAGACYIQYDLFDCYTLIMKPCQQRWAIHILVHFKLLQGTALADLRYGGMVHLVIVNFCLQH